MATVLDFDDLPTRVVAPNQVLECDMCVAQIHRVATLQCGHEIHFECGIEWFQQKRNRYCPWCRHHVIANSESPPSQVTPLSWAGDWDSLSGDGPQLLSEVHDVIEGLLSHFMILKWIAEMAI